MLDIPVLAHTARLSQRLIDIKWVIKEEVKYIPGLGLGLMVIGSLFLKRNWTRDRRRIESTFRRMTCQGHPFLLMLFPEGTRFTPEKVRSPKSIKHFNMRHMQCFSEVLFPKLKGFVASVQLLRPKIDAVYDITIVYPTEEPLGINYFSGKLDKVTVHIKRTAVSDLPEDESGVGEWLVEAFRQKDELIHNIKQQAAFASLSQTRTTPQKACRSI
jgi:1-acyl-sn-glycerol-3-phosphate acyltransferase